MEHGLRAGGPAVGRHAAAPHHHILRAGRGSDELAGELLRVADEASAVAAQVEDHRGGAGGKAVAQHRLRGLAGTGVESGHLQVQHRAEGAREHRRNGQVGSARGDVDCLPGPIDGQRDARARLPADERGHLVELLIEAGPH